MLGVYFSGTGNTKFCVDKFLEEYGDGAGLLARLLNRYGASIVGGLHIKMPDSIGDVKALKRDYEKIENW